MELARETPRAKATENATVIKDIQERIVKSVPMASMKHLEMRASCCAHNVMLHVTADAQDLAQKVAPTARTAGS
jgi:hypothetical protein